MVGPQEQHRRFDAREIFRRELVLGIAAFAGVTRFADGKLIERPAQIDQLFGDVAVRFVEEPAETFAHVLTARIRHELTRQPSELAEAGVGLLLRFLIDRNAEMRADRVDDLADAFGMIDGRPERDRTAERLADQVRAFDARRVHVVDEVLDERRHRRRQIARIGEAVTVIVDRARVELIGERDDVARERFRVTAAAVQHDDRHPAAGLDAARANAGCIVKAHFGAQQLEPERRRHATPACRRYRAACA